MIFVSDKEIKQQEWGSIKRKSFKSVWPVIDQKGSHLWSTDAWHVIFKRKIILFCYNILKIKVHSSINENCAFVL